MESTELEPQPASTIVLMRAGNTALEVLLLRRSSRLVFFGGAWVFPGGRVDDGDGPAEQLELRARRAAVRELEEEAGLVTDAAQLIHFAQWVTPPGQPRRFDTWYFAACAGEGTVRVDAREVEDHRWMSPAEALQARAEGRIELPPPTFVTLSELSAHRDPLTACRELASRPVLRYAPRPCPVQGGKVYLYEGDAGFASRDPSAPGIRHRLLALQDGWRYERPAW